MGKLYTEASSLRTLKIMPRNFNEIVRSWIRLPGSIPDSSDTVEYCIGAADEAVLKKVDKYPGQNDCKKTKI